MLRAGGVRELFVEAARLQASGGTVEVEGLLGDAGTVDATAARRLPVTLAVTGDWPAAASAETSTPVLVAALRRLRRSAEEHGLTPVGFHLDLTPPRGEEALERYAETLAGVRRALDGDLFVSVSLDPPALRTEGVAEVAEGGGFPGAVSLRTEARRRPGAARRRRLEAHRPGARPGAPGRARPAVPARHRHGGPEGLPRRRRTAQGGDHHRQPRRAGTAPGPVARPRRPARYPRPPELRLPGGSPVDGGAVAPGARRAGAGAAPRAVPDPPRRGPRRGGRPAAPPGPALRPPAAARRGAHRDSAGARRGAGRRTGAAGADGGSRSRRRRPLPLPGALRQPRPGGHRRRLLREQLRRAPRPRRRRLRRRRAGRLPALSARARRAAGHRHAGATPRRPAEAVPAVRRGGGDGGQRAGGAARRAAVGTGGGSDGPVRGARR